MDWSWEKGGAYISVPVEIKPKRKAMKARAKKKPARRRKKTASKVERSIPRPHHPTHER